jgi:vancomycin resistance protein VanW
LHIVIKSLNHIVIKPGETFSIYRLIGSPTRKKGYLEGVELSFGEARSGIGGGICQISNLIHWMALHTPLVITERSNHSFDPFPDCGRILPFGSGAALFYNFIDLMLYNPSSSSFQINLWITAKTLEGEICSNNFLAKKYHVYEKDHAFINIENNTYRRNEMWRDTFSKGHHKTLLVSEILYSNFSKVKYKID